jgi:L-lactate oxidase
MASNRCEFLTSTAVAAALTGSAALLKPVAVAAADDSGPPLQHFANCDAPTDVKALALGANVVAIGRPVLFALALGGWMGVQGVLEHLNTEFKMTMRLAGAKSVADISKAYLSS